MCSVSEGLGSGDSLFIRNILNSELSERCQNIEMLEEEIHFHDFSHKGRKAARKVALQGEYINDGLDMPLYRTPGDYRQQVQQWSPIVNEIRAQLSNFFRIPFNHVKMQLYRDGNDYITKHSDKTLDIKIGSPIVNLNLGTTRIFTLQNKLTGEIQNFEFAHNSVFVIGWKTNINWTHCVNKDSRSMEKRISLVFRDIATWMTPDGFVFGQGGIFHTKEELIGQSTQNLASPSREDAQLMLEAFSLENRMTYDGSDYVEYWRSIYGTGFNSTDLSPLL